MFKKILKEIASYRTCWVMQSINGANNSNLQKNKSVLQMYRKLNKSNDFIITKSLLFKLIKLNNNFAQTLKI